MRKRGLRNSLIEPKTSLLTNNYFGSVSNAIFGQTVTKIPLVQKNSLARKFTDHGPIIYQNTHQNACFVNQYIRPKALASFKLESE